MPRPDLSRPADLRRLLVRVALLASAGCRSDGDDVPSETDPLDTDVEDTVVVDTDVEDTDTDVEDTDTDVEDTDTDTVDTLVETDTDTVDTLVETDTDTVDTLVETDTDPGAPWGDPTCVGGVWRPLGALSPASPRTHLLMATPAGPDTGQAGWWDTGPYVPEVLDEVGTRCDGAVDPAACFVAVDDALAAGAERMLLSTDGGAPTTWTGAAEILGVLGTIDTPDEALLRLWSQGELVRCWGTSVRPVADGYEVVRQLMVSSCPIRYEDFLSHVAADGTVTDLGSTPSDDTGGGCIGRRPPGLVEGAVGTSLGRRLARHAALEAASVVAFEHLHAELVALGAPSSLLRRVKAAARDEVRHAAQVGALARRYGCEPEAPEVRPSAPRDAEAIAIDNAVEGCVGESWGALVGLWQAEHAADATLAATMRRIARDEVRHASLSWAIDAWLSARLDDAARARVASAKAEALARLVARAGRPIDPARVSAFGEPDADAAVRLLDGLAAALAA